MAEEQIVRSLRVPLSTDKQIRRIAEYEDRTISKVMQRLLDNAVNNYLELHEQSMLDFEERYQKHKVEHKRLHEQN